MKKFALFFVLLLVATSCIVEDSGSDWFEDDFNDGTIDQGGSSYSTNANELTQYLNALGEPTGGITSTFGYTDDKLRVNGRYEFRDVNDGIAIYDMQSGSTSLVYMITYESGTFKKFESFLTGGYFEVVSDVLEKEKFAVWKQCGTCVEKQVKFEESWGFNVEYFEVYSSNGQLEQRIEYTYDSNSNPFFRSFHLPDQFLVDLEYMVRAFSCNNILTASDVNYTYQYNTYGYPTEIYRGVGREVLLSKEIKY